MAVPAERPSDLDPAAGHTSQIPWRIAHVCVTQPEALLFRAGIEEIGVYLAWCFFLNPLRTDGERQTAPDPLQGGGLDATLQRYAEGNCPTGFGVPGFQCNIRVTSLVVAVPSPHDVGAVLAGATITPTRR